jgi:hypothetical protein
VAHQRDPLDPTDDGIEAPSFFQVRPVLARSPVAGILLPAVQLQYDWLPDYDQMWFYRATSPDGPWGDPLPGLDNSGVYSDTAVQAGQPYWYRIEGVSGLARQVPPISSAVLTSEEVTPAEDPYPPEAHVLINGGAASTAELDVMLTFVPYEAEGEDPLEVFEDIAWIKISNDPSFTGASWQPVADIATVTVPWHLDAARGEIAKVYALFRDAALNESIGPEVGRILYPHLIYLPLVWRTS